MEPTQVDVGPVHMLSPGTGNCNIDLLYCYTSTNLECLHHLTPLCNIDHYSNGVLLQIRGEAAKEAWLWDISYDSERSVYH